MHALQWVVALNVVRSNEISFQRSCVYSRCLLVCVFVRVCVQVGGARGEVAGLVGVDRQVLWALITSSPSSEPLLKHKVCCGGGSHSFLLLCAG